MPTAGKSSFFRVHQKIYLALYDAKQTENMALHAISGKHVVVPITSKCGPEPNASSEEVGFSPSSLAEIYKFNEIVNEVARRNPDSKVIFAAGTNTQHHIRVVFLIGCHLMISLGIDAERTFKVFKKFDEFFVCGAERSLGMIDCWRSFHRAALMGWVDFKERFDLEFPDEYTIDMEEFIHYSRFAIQLHDCQKILLLVCKRNAKRSTYEPSISIRTAQSAQPISLCDSRVIPWSK